VKGLRTRRLVANFALLSGGELASKVLSLAAFAYLARTLGPDKFGHLEFAISATVFLGLLVDCGLSPYGAREVARDPHAPERLALSLIAVRSALALGALGLLGGLLWTLGRPGAPQALLLLYGLTLLFLPWDLSWVFQGRDQMRVVAGASVLRWGVFAAGVLSLVRAPADVLRVPVIEAAALLGVACFYLKCFGQSLAYYRGRLNLRSALSHLRGSLPIGLAKGCWALKVHLGTLFLGMTMSSQEVAWFGATNRIVLAFHSFVWLYFFNLFPSMSRFAASEPDALPALVQRSIRLAVWAGVLCAVLSTALAPTLVVFAYGTRFESAAAPLRVLIAVIPLALASGHFRYLLIACNRQGDDLLAAAGGAGLNALLNFLLTPSHGALGAAVAMVVSEGLIWALAWGFVRRKVAAIPTWTQIRAPLFTGAALAPALWWAPIDSPWIAATLAAALFGAAVVLLEPRLLREARELLSQDSPSI
jgi:O-antigen/teichoic acid export membrane protein